MNRYKGVIFDLDGTLADTSLSILNSVRYVQKSMGLKEISLEDMYYHVGPPMEESYRRNFGIEDKKLSEAIKLHKKYAMDFGYKEVELYPHVIDVIEILKKYGIKVAVATLKAQETAIKIFELLNLYSKLDCIVGTDQKVIVNKRMAIEKCITYLNLNKNEVVLIGDSSYDAIGASDAGIDFIGVTYGFGFKSKEEVDKYSNIGCISKIDELLFMLQQL